MAAQHGELPSADTCQWIKMAMEPIARQLLVNLSCSLLTCYRVLDLNTSGTAAGSSVGVARAARLIAVKTLGDDG